VAEDVVRDIAKQISQGGSAGCPLLSRGAHYGDSQRSDLVMILGLIATGGTRSPSGGIAGYLEI
jgi:hypothetical protein